VIKDYLDQQVQLERLDQRVLPQQSPDRLAHKAQRVLMVRADLQAQLVQQAQVVPPF
jgi:hypothetical protein